jgi:hypothetical protein
MAAIRPVCVTSAVSSVNLLLRVQEKDHKRQIIVELEEVQIRIIDPRQANPDEVIGDVLDPLQTDDLPVKFMASRSRHTTNDDQERFSARARKGFSLLEVEYPAIFCGRLIATLSRRGHLRQSKSHEAQEDDAHLHKQSPTVNFWYRFELTQLTGL